MKDIVTIDKNEILQYASIGEKLVLTPEADDALCKLLDLKDFIDAVVEDVKSKIVESATSEFPTFKGVVGTKLKAVYRAYGDKYESDNEEFTKEIISRRTDSKKIEDYINETGELPDGVSEKKQTYRLVMTRL